MSSLIKKIIAGDKSAVYQFYKQYAPLIRRYITYRIPKDTDPDDFLQEVFFEAIDTIAFLKNEDHLTHWLYTIARNKIADFYRRKKIKQLLLSEISFLQLVDKEVHEPEFIFEKNALRDKIERAFKILPKKYQMILRLHYEEGIPIKQIALRLSLSFKATESLLFRARKRFALAYERV